MRDPVCRDSDKRGLAEDRQKVRLGLVGVVGGNQRFHIGEHIRVPFGAQVDEVVLLSLKAPAPQEIVGRIVRDEPFERLISLV